METIKLERNGKVIERTKADYETNKVKYNIRGFTEYVEKPKPQPKVEVKPEPQPEPKKDSEWQKPIEPKKPTSKKVE